MAAKFGAEVLTNAERVSLDICGSARRVTFADGTSIDAHTVILATGVTLPASWRLPPARADRARGVLRVRADRASACLGQDIYVVGGANSAGQAAVFLSRPRQSR